MKIFICKKLALLSFVFFVLTAFCGCDFASDFFGGKNNKNDKENSEESVKLSEDSIIKEKEIEKQIENNQTELEKKLKESLKARLNRLSAELKEHKHESQNNAHNKAMQNHEQSFKEPQNPRLQNAHEHQLKMIEKLQKHNDSLGE